MSNYTGVVSKIFPRSSWGSYSFGMQGVQGYFGLGKVPPTFSEGMTIEFNGNPAKRAGNVDVIPESIIVVTEQAVKTEDYSMGKLPSGARKVQVLQKDDYWSNREARDQMTQKVIELQSCRNSAIALLQAVGPGELSPEDFVDSWVNTFLEQNAKHKNV